MPARSAVFALTALAILSVTSRARADPLFGWGENALEDQFVDGDIDEEDHVAMRLGGHTATSDVRGESWVSLVGFTKSLMSGRNDVGGIVVVGLALDRVATGPVHGIADPPKPPPAPSAMPAAGAKAPRPPIALALDPMLARDCVRAALRTSGLGVGDERIDALVARARTSAWLPETRMRAMRLFTDASHDTTVAATDTTNYYDSIGANLVLELRLTWRLDRLLFAGDESTLERVRLERQDARTRVATRTLEVLFAWQRASIDAREAAAGSREELEARLHVAESLATLDVLTGGWFSEHDAPNLDPSSGDR